MIITVQYKENNAAGIVTEEHAVVKKGLAIGMKISKFEQYQKQITYLNLNHKATCQMSRYTKSKAS